MRAANSCSTGTIRSWPSVDLAERGRAVRRRRWTSRRTWSAPARPWPSPRGRAGSAAAAARPRRRSGACAVLITRFLKRQVLQPERLQQRVGGGHRRRTSEAGTPRSTPAAPAAILPTRRARCHEGGMQPHRRPPMLVELARRGGRRGARQPRALLAGRAVRRRWACRRSPGPRWSPMSAAAC